MHAHLKGSLEQINKCWNAFEHRGQKMSKAEVIKVLNYGIEKGYETTAQLTDEEVDKVLGWQICYKSEKPCKHKCGGLCKESC